MRKKDSTFIFSPSDLSGFISCKHLIQLNIKFINGELKKPLRESRVIDQLRERGAAFEADFLTQLKTEGKSVIEIDKEDKQAIESTIKAMKLGADVIYQARLVRDNWGGWADYLLKRIIPEGQAPSLLGNWYYEVLDTKLASETKAGTILQIAVYTDIVSGIQGVQAEYMWVKKPDGEERYRVNDYMAYVRFVQNELKVAVENQTPTYPEVVPHCEVCDWWTECNKKRRADDHLSFVAGMGTGQIKEVRNAGIFNLEQMADPLPSNFIPSRGSIETYKRLQHQASLQRKVRDTGVTAYDMLPLVPQQGLFVLPEPNDHDIFLDLEGDPLVEGGGREYVFGWVYKGEYFICWAESADEEKRSFERFIDEATRIKLAHPGMHIYHYNHYEPTAFKRLMSKYGTRENETDALLRSLSFVDLYTITRKALRAGVERYSLKDLEKYHGFVREMDLRKLSTFKADYEYLLESEQLDEITPTMREAIAKYNEDDCRSTIYLQSWLEKERKKIINAGGDIPRPDEKPGDASEKITVHQLRIKPIMEILLQGLPADTLQFTKDEKAKFILAHMLDWYRREAKSYWWEYFRLIEMDEEDLLDEKLVLAQLEFTGETEDVKRSTIYTYEFPQQECDIGVGKKLKDRNGNSAGDVVEIDKENGRIRIKKGPSIKDKHESPLFYLERYDPRDKEESIITLANFIVESGIDGVDLEYRCAKDLLTRHLPRFIQPPTQAGTALEKAIDRAVKLDHSVLPIQGPPGAGKSFTGSHIILALIQQRKKIGVTALSHKVITNLLEAVNEKADELGVKISMIQKIGQSEDNLGKWEETRDSSRMTSAVGNFDLIAGTPFMWASPDFTGGVDYMIVDEAGQLSLIDTLAISHSTKNLLLLGDPQQLKQPQQGVHPDGTDVSALEHLLAGEKTITDEQGVFLGETYRMHPEICSLDSELFYEDKLRSVNGLLNQRLEGNTRFAGSGLFFEKLRHEGNTNYSLEEVELVVRIVEDLCKGDVFYIDKGNKKVRMLRDYIKIIAPYNNQVNELKVRLPGMKIGTVDKFQGQEAGVVICSMATSNPEDAPRGMEFLYSPNRFNVAISRARAVFILVASEALFKANCKSPDQIRLANAFCRFWEKAKIN